MYYLFKKINLQNFLINMVELIDYCKLQRFEKIMY
jgi:hypothetical protein